MNDYERFCRDYGKTPLEFAMAASENAYMAGEIQLEIGGYGAGFLKENAFFKTFGAYLGFIESGVTKSGVLRWQKAAQKHYEQCVLLADSMPRALCAIHFKALTNPNALKEEKRAAKRFFEKQGHFCKYRNNIKASLKLERAFLRYKKKLRIVDDSSGNAAAVDDSKGKMQAESVDVIQADLFARATKGKSGVFGVDDSKIAAAVDEVKGKSGVAEWKNPRPVQSANLSALFDSFLVARP